MNYKRGKARNRVTAIFRDAALYFDMARETTLGQLAEQLDALGELHGGLPIAVNVRVPQRVGRLLQR
jgi:hypothetical protein